MKRQAPKWAARYDALAARERWLAAAVVLGAMVLIGYAAVFDPALRQGQAAERRLREQQAQLDSLGARTAQVAEDSPEATASAQLARLKTQLGELSGRLAVMENSLVPPQRMAGLLEDMIGRTSLRLLSLRTLPVAPLLPMQAGSAEAAKLANKSAGLFKHGIEIKLEGSYSELVVYLQRLEQSKLKLLWSSVSLSTEKHPQLHLTLTVYTLSLDRAWLIV